MNNRFEIDPDTGEWLSDFALSPIQANVIAASVLPGVTPEIVECWYAEWLCANEAEVDA